jgi:DNA invertase Pin-like site-specific DNA recombinase
MKRTAKIEKVALCARVSTKDGRQDTENQLGLLREYCLNQGWEIAGEYVDHETGGHSKRPHFQRMFADARARKFDLVLFLSLDRLSREGVSATLGHLERLTSYGVGWRSHTEEYLDSCGIFRDAVLGILATIAKQEHIRRSERASAAITRLRRQGQADKLGRKRNLFDRDRARRLRATRGRVLSNQPFGTSSQSPTLEVVEFVDVPLGKAEGRPVRYSARTSLVPRQSNYRVRTGPQLYRPP